MTSFTICIISILLTCGILMVVFHTLRQENIKLDEGEFLIFAFLVDETLATFLVHRLVFVSVAWIAQTPSFLADGDTGYGGLERERWNDKHSSAPVTEWSKGMWLQAESESFVIISLTPVVTYIRSFPSYLLFTYCLSPQLLQRYLHQYGHELPSLSFRRAYLWLCYMQDSSGYYSFYDVSSELSLMCSPPSLLCLTLLWTGFQWPTWSSISLRWRVSHSLPQGPIIQLTYVNLLPQCKCRWRRTWWPPNDNRKPHRPRYLLLQMRHYPRLEIRK